MDGVGKLPALRGQGVRSLGKDDPAGDVGEYAETVEQAEDRGCNANEIEVPAEMEREGRTDSAEDARGSGTFQLWGTEIGFSRACVGGGSLSEWGSGGPVLIVP